LADLAVRVKNHPLAAGVITVLLCIVLGTVAGLLFAIEAARSITEGARAGDPLDMLPFVTFMYVALGFCGGAIVGLFAGSAVYFGNRQRRPKHLEPLV
jgi:ammonia channel protein AmtB